MVKNVFVGKFNPIVENLNEKKQSGIENGLQILLGVQKDIGWKKSIEENSWSSQLKRFESRNQVIGFESQRRCYQIWEVLNNMECAELQVLGLYICMEALQKD